jgi:hypothetical protein
MQKSTSLHLLRIKTCSTEDEDEDAWQSLKFIILAFKSALTSLRLEIECFYSTSSLDKKNSLLFFQEQGPFLG